MTAAGSSGSVRSARGEAPRVSVVTAVYNGERYVREAIDSLLHQSFSNFELIVIDDASTDGTPAILQSIRDPRVRLLHNDRNLGLARSLNRGIAAATGEYVARQDADDVSEPDRLRRQVAYLDAHPDVALLGSAHREIDPDGRPIRDVDAHCSHTTLVWAMLFYCPFVHSAVMFRRQTVVDAVGVYDPSYRYSMDFEYWSRIAARFRIANLPEQLVRLRMHDTSMTATYGPHTGEGQSLRVREVARLLRTHTDAPAGVLPADEDVHRVLSALVSGPPADCVAAELLEGVDVMLALQDGFARHHRLTPAESAAHRAELRRHTATVLVEFADAAGGQGDPRAAWRLVARALRLDPRLLLRSRDARAVISVVRRRLSARPSARRAGGGSARVPSPQHGDDRDG